MIAKKTYICDCGRKSLGFRKCAGCRQKKYSENTQLRKNKEAYQPDNSDIVEYFKFHVSEIERTKACCAECGVRLGNPSHWNVAHVLPKGIFKSIRSLKENAIYLCVPDHKRADSSIQELKKMKIWGIWKVKVNQIKQLAKEKHKILHEFEQETG